jgi:hypothetical protein
MGRRKFMSKSIVEETLQSENTIALLQIPEKEAVQILDVKVYLGCFSEENEFNKG